MRTQQPRLILRPDRAPIRSRYILGIGLPLTLLLLLASLPGVVGLTKSMLAALPYLMYFAGIFAWITPGG